MKKLYSLLISLILLLSNTGCSNDFIGTMHLYLPGEYISEEVIEQFQYEYKIQVIVDTFGSNEEMYTKLLGGLSYDVIIPSDYMIERLLEDEMLQPIDKSIVTNIDYLYDGVLNQTYDPNNDYSIPYFWGNVGIVFDETMIDEDDVYNQGWEVLRNTKYKGITYMYDSARDSFMIPLKVLGYSMNTDNEDELNEAYNWLVKQNQTMELSYASDECIDGLAYCTDGKYMGVMYSGDAAYILDENENMRFYAPPGTNFWVDAMCIPKNAKEVEYANMFINFMIDYDSQYDNSSYVGYCTVNKEALRDLTAEDGDYAENEAYLPRERTDLDESFTSGEKTRKITSELWSKVIIQN